MLNPLVGALIAVAALALWLAVAGVIVYARAGQKGGWHKLPGPGIATKVAAALSRGDAPPARWAYLLPLLFTPVVLWMSALAHSNDVIAAREQTATAIVIGHDTDNHNSYEYRYVVAGREYTGWDTPQSDLRLGQRTDIYYDPLNPATSALHDFSERAGNNWGAAVWASMLVVGFLALLRHQRRAARGSSAAVRPGATRSL